MTTIAIDREAGVVAFDSRITVGNEIVYKCPKVWVSAKHPVIYAGAGVISLIHAATHFLDYSKKLPWDVDDWWDPVGMPNLKSDTYLAVIHRDGRAFIYEHPHFYPIESRYVTLGSGGQAAHAALLCGKTPVEAVAIACRVDTGSGLPVHKLLLADIPVPTVTRPTRRRRRR